MRQGAVQTLLMRQGAVQTLLMRQGAVQALLIVIIIMKEGSSILT